MSQNTLEYRTMLKCTAVSETAVKDHLTVIAGELLAESIISPENASTLRNPAIDTAERAAKLVELVTNKVKLSTSIYHIFVEVLMRRQEDNKIILELLEQTYKDLKGELNTILVDILAIATMEHNASMQFVTLSDCMGL